MLIGGHLHGQMAQVNGPILTTLRPRAWSFADWMGDKVADLTHRKENYYSEKIAIRIGRARPSMYISANIMRHEAISVEEAEQAYMRMVFEGRSECSITLY